MFGFENHVTRNHVHSTQRIELHFHDQITTVNGLVKTEIFISEFCNDRDSRAFLAQTYSAEISSSCCCSNNTKHFTPNTLLFRSIGSSQTLI